MKRLKLSYFFLLYCFVGSAFAQSVDTDIIKTSSQNVDLKKFKENEEKDERKHFLMRTKKYIMQNACQHPYIAAALLIIPTIVALYGSRHALSCLATKINAHIITPMTGIFTSAATVAHGKIPLDTRNSVYMGRVPVRQVPIKPALQKELDTVFTEIPFHNCPDLELLAPFVSQNVYDSRAKNDGISDFCPDLNTQPVSFKVNGFKLQADETFKLEKSFDEKCKALNQLYHKVSRADLGELQSETKGYVFKFIEKLIRGKIEKIVHSSMSTDKKISELNKLSEYSKDYSDLDEYLYMHLNDQDISLKIKNAKTMSAVADIIKKFYQKNTFVGSKAPINALIQTVDEASNKNKKTSTIFKTISFINSFLRDERKHNRKNGDFSRIIVYGKNYIKYINDIYDIYPEKQFLSRKIYLETREEDDTSVFVKKYSYNMKNIFSTEGIIFLELLDNQMSCSSGHWKKSV